MNTGFPRHLTIRFFPIRPPISHCPIVPNPRRHALVLKLTLGDGTHLNLNLRQSQNVRRSGHVTQHIDCCALHTRGTKGAEGTDHKVGDVSGGVGVLGTVGAEIGDISGGGRGGSGDVSGGGEESLLEARWCGES